MLQDIAMYYNGNVIKCFAIYMHIFYIVNFYMSILYVAIDLPII